MHPKVQASCQTCGYSSISWEQTGGLRSTKARLVVKRYKQKYGIDYQETFSSVCRYESIRLLLRIAAAEQMEMIQFDVITAFLYGELKETVYMDLLEGYECEDPNKVCLLKKIVNGAS